MKTSIREWLLLQRTSVRLGFGLQVFVMVGNALLSLLWTRALIRVLGDSTYGLFVSFLGVTRLGGLGDLGLTGAVAIRSGQAMGRGDFDWLKGFLPAARALLLVLAVVLPMGFLVTSPWLPGWLGFAEQPGSGSLTLLFATIAPALVVLLAGGYFNALNYANGTVMWPVIPGFIFGQLAVLGQWTAASLGAPLWAQHLLMVGAGALGTIVAWRMTKVPTPWLGDLLPLRYDPDLWRGLATTSGWSYLYGLGAAIYWTTDRLLINAGFGASVVPSYLVNFKLCELVLQLIISAGSVSQPKFIRWIASSHEEERSRAVTEIRRLGTFQALLGVAGAAVYLFINDWFVSIWLGPAYSVPTSWQLAFALNLAITAGSAVATHTAGLCGPHGLRNASLTVAFSAIVNLGLSFVAMRFGSIAGIAFSTVIAQLASGVVMTFLTSRHLKMEFPRWAAKSCFLPVATIGAIFALQQWFDQPTATSMVLKVVSAAIVTLVYAKVIGVNQRLLAHEWHSIVAILKPRASA